MWFIERMGMIFAKEHIFKGQKLKSCERYIARLKPGSVAELMKSIEDRLADYALSDDAGVRRTSEEGFALCEGIMACDEARSGKR